MGRSKGRRERRDIIRQLDIIVTESGNNGENVTRGESTVLITDCQTKGNVVRMRERLRQELLTPSEKVGGAGGGGGGEGVCVDDDVAQVSIWHPGHSQTDEGRPEQWPEVLLVV